MSDLPGQSLPVRGHVERTNCNRSDEIVYIWTTMFSGEIPNYAGEGYAVVCPALHAFCEAFERHEAKEEAARRGGLPLGEFYNTAFPSPRYAALHAMGPMRDSYNDTEDVTADTIILDRFWWLYLQRLQRQEETPVNTFVKAWLLLERREEMTETGMGRMAEVDRLLELLIDEEFAGLFPLTFAPEKWCRLLDADFSKEDCKILFLLHLDYFRQAYLLAD
ncbi:hypothetical protein E4U28_005245 [Claviceps purpurea]|nr:hypothetical protein E4U28_005245 [Claviceps purpurea]